MHPILKNQFKTAIQSRTGDNFQKFCEQLFIKKYGPNFQVVKNKKDGGGDGILNNDTVIAMYSPEKENLNTFRAKINDDYGKYDKSWKSRYNKWCFVYNGELTRDRTEILDTFCKGSERLDINQLLEFVEELVYPRMKELADYLGIDEQLVIYDVLKNVIDALVKGDIDIGIRNPVPLDIIRKVKKNYLPEDVDEAIKEYGEMLPYITYLQKVLKEYNDAEINALQNKTKHAYLSLGGDFKDKVNNLVERFSETHQKDDMYVFYTRVIIIYFFERCVVGDSITKTV